MWTVVHFNRFDSGGGGRFHKQTRQSLRISLGPIPELSPLGGFLIYRPAFFPATVPPKLKKVMQNSYMGLIFPVTSL